jgi:hypothetical protein
VTTEFLRRILDLELSELIVGLVLLGCDIQWPPGFHRIFFLLVFNRTLCGFYFRFNAMINNIVLFYPREEHSINFFINAPHGGLKVVFGFGKKVFHMIKDCCE